MFSLAAINDTDSEAQWEPLAPTKEAQEFHLSQTYQEGLLRLQSEEYDKAREMFETVLKDPLISNALVDNSVNDAHLLQLRFLALKNLATVFLEQGPAHYESALKCYLQAVELDDKDSVVWNQLGTLSCMMGLLSISRWAFEQGLFCSPNNWNCMEKLLEVLIAIKDEVACLSVAELILRHWPSHSRALHVKTTIQESNPIPFVPHGVDKLEPKHAKLKFSGKRKSTGECGEENNLAKRCIRSMDIRLPEASWMSLLDAILKINESGHGDSLGPLLPEGNCDTRLCIQLPSNSEYVGDSLETTVGNTQLSARNVCCELSSKVEKEGSSVQEPQHERRSTRLERLRSRKPGKEGVTTGNDSSKVVLQSLEPFLFDRLCSKDLDHASGICPLSSSENVTADSEESDVAKFVLEASKNYGACHMAYLLLEEVTSRSLSYQGCFVKLLELDHLARCWGQDRTTRCSLFLAELYYDTGCCSVDELKRSHLFSESSYHLCKVIELVALEAPLDLTRVWNISSNVEITMEMNDLSAQPFSLNRNEVSDFIDEPQFWIRFFWLSGRLSVFSGDKEKAYKEFCIALFLFRSCKNEKDHLGMVPLPHCKLVKGISSERLKHEINLLKVDSLMRKTTNEMIESRMYMEWCVKLLSPLLLLNNDIYRDLLSYAYIEGKGVSSVELSALDVLISACDQTQPMEIEAYLNSHRRKLHLLSAAAGMLEFSASHKVDQKSPLQKSSGSSETEGLDTSEDYWAYMVAEEVKAVSASASLMKSFMDQNGASIGIIPMKSIGDIQSLLLSIMCSNVGTCQKSSCLGMTNQTEQLDSQIFIDAAISFCKLQHLNFACPIKLQVELIVAVHDLLAEFGLCYSGKDSKGEEGTFLKLAIKHLLALDMKLKSNLHCTNNAPEVKQNCLGDSQPDGGSDAQMSLLDKAESGVLDSVSPEELTTEIGFVPDSLDNDEGVEIEKSRTDEKLDSRDQVKVIDEVFECGIENALDQCFFCLYGLNLKADSSSEDDLVVHRNTSLGDYQTKEQCFDVFQYILPYAKASSRSGLVKLRKILRAIRSHFPQPPDNILKENPIDKFLDDPDLCEDELSDIAATESHVESIINKVFPDQKGLKTCETLASSCEQYLELYSNLYYFLAQADEMNATDKWPGFVLTKEGEDFIEQHVNLLKYDLLYNPLRFDSWKRLATIYDEEVDLLLNDGSKHINVVEWRKHHSLPQRVEVSRRRARRCSLMSLAVATTHAQKSQMHELLALVYYDSLQNVVPFYDQRTVVPKKNEAWMFLCQNSMKHFKKAFEYKPDWLHAFYLGKLCEKMKYPAAKVFSYYQKAVNLNPSAVDTVYRIHASRLKLLYKGGKQNMEALQVVTAHSFSQITKETVLKIFGWSDEELHFRLTAKNNIEVDSEKKPKDDELPQLEEVWNILFKDCLSALKTCVEGELKHFHKARYKMAQGLYRRRQTGDLERAKDELSFCFRSSRSSFTINMWEIDGIVRKGRRKTPGLGGNKKLLEVSLSESSRKFITCIRKYTLLYLSLLEKTRDFCMLDRAYTSLRTDRRFSLCLEDIVPLALGRYVQTLVFSIRQEDRISSGGTTSEHLLDRMFNLFMDHGNLWAEISNLPELKKQDLSETTLYSYIHVYIHFIEKDARLDMLEAINEKIRKRFKNPKLSNTHCARICKHASVAWCRSILISLASITPFNIGNMSSEESTPPSGGLEFGGTLLYIDLQVSELWNSSSFEDLSNVEGTRMKWAHVLDRIKNIQIKQVSEENMEAATALLKSAYTLYRDTSGGTSLSGLNMYAVPHRLLLEGTCPPQGSDGVETLDLGVSRKLLLWAYTLVFGRYSDIPAVIKHCEETAKVNHVKMKRGTAASPVLSQTNISSSTQTVGSAGKEKSSSSDCGEVVDNTLNVTFVPKLEEDFTRASSKDSSVETLKTLPSPPLQQCNNSIHSAKTAQSGQELQ